MVLHKYLDKFSVERERDAERLRRLYDDGERTAEDVIGELNDLLARSGSRSEVVQRDVDFALHNIEVIEKAGIKRNDPDARRDVPAYKSEHIEYRQHLIEEYKHQIEIYRKLKEVFASIGKGDIADAISNSIDKINRQYGDLINPEERFGFVF